MVVVDQGMAQEEKILVTSRTGTTLTYAVGGRGADSTNAAGHSSGAAIYPCWSAVEADDANDHIYTTARDDHTQYLNATRHDVATRHTFGAAFPTPAAPPAIATAASAGTGAGPAHSDHTHNIGAGAINAPNMFVTGAVDANALGASTQTWTPTLTQGAALTNTVNEAKYVRVGGVVWFWLDLLITSAGTVSNIVTVGLPTGLPAVGHATNGQIGTCFYYVAAQGGARYVGNFELSSTTTVVLSVPQIVGTGLAITSANGDIIRGNGFYRVA